VRTRERIDAWPADLAKGAGTAPASGFFSATKLAVSTVY